MGTCCVDKKELKVKVAGMGKVRRTSITKGITTVNPGNQSCNESKGKR